MAKLSKEQIAVLNNDINNGTILTAVHNSRYHFIIKINTECVVIQSMLAEDSDKGLIINLKDLRNEFDAKRSEESGTNEASAVEDTAESTSE